MNSRHETPSKFNKTRTVPNWLEPPELINTNESHLSVQLDSVDERTGKNDQVAQPTSQDEFMRELSKVRLDVRQSRHRLDASTQQLNQSKSTDSLSNKNRLQFIQQKFKEKDQLLVLQQNIIQNLKRDIRHRDRIIQTIGEAPQHEEMGGSRGIVTNCNLSRQEDGLLRKLKESRLQSHRKSGVDLDKQPQREVLDSAQKNQQLLSFVSEVEPYPEYNVKVFPSEDCISSQIIPEMAPVSELNRKSDGRSSANNISTTADLRQRLARLAKEHQSSRIEHRSIENKLRKDLERKVQDYEKLALKHELMQKELDSVRNDHEKMKYELDCSRRQLETEKSKSFYAQRKTKEFDAVEKSLRTALNARDNEIRQLNHDISQLKAAPKLEIIRHQSHTDEQLKIEMESTKIQLISKELEVKDLQRFCKRLQTELAAAKEQLKINDRHRMDTTLDNSTYLRIEETSHSLNRSKHHEKVIDKPLISKATSPKQKKTDLRPEHKPEKPQRHRHNCLDSSTVLNRSKSITYYPTLKWNRVVN